MALHPKTKVQRAKSPREELRRHHEESDAPPAKVTAGVAVLFSLVLFGLAVAAGTIEWRDGRHGLVMRAPSPPLFAHASLPPLLADPVRNRREVEAEARSHLDPTKIEAAMEEVEREKGGGKQ
jgi:hypothetical protein